MHAVGLAFARGARVFHLALPVSSVIIVGALLAAGLEEWGMPKVLGFVAVVLASVNIFGGFVVTHRMLSMFKKKTPAKAKQ